MDHRVEPGDDDFQMEIKEMRMKIAVIFIIAAVLTLGATASAEMSGDVVKIGVLSDMSGLYSDIGGPGSVEAARMAIADFGGSLHGKKIELVSAGHQTRPDVGSVIATQWFGSDGVDAIVDVPNSSVALAVQEIARNKNKVLLVSGAAASDLTGKACSPTSVHWTYDTLALANGTGAALVKAGGDTWFFITADYAFGHDLEAQTSAVVKQMGGQVVGGVRVPLNTSDFSSYLLQAQSSKAKVIGLANAGGDTINSVKQAAEFGIVKAGQRMAGLLVFITDVNSLGLDVAQGLQFTEAFYWDMNDDTRAWTKRFVEKMNGRLYPTMNHAGNYGGMLHYLKAVEAAQTTDGVKVVQKMKELPTKDVTFGEGRVREDGRHMHPMYLWQVKKPAESKAKWDYYTLVKMIPADEAWRPLDQGGCPLVAKKS